MELSVKKSRKADDEFESFARELIEDKGSKQ